MKRLLLAAALLVASSALWSRPSVEAAGSLDGLWDAIVVAGGTEVPFRFEIATSGSDHMMARHTMRLPVLGRRVAATAIGGCVVAIGISPSTLYMVFRAASTVN